MHSLHVIKQLRDVKTKEVDEDESIQKVRQIHQTLCILFAFGFPHMHLINPLGLNTANIIITISIHVVALLTSIAWIKKIAKIVSSKKVRLI